MFNQQAIVRNIQKSEAAQKLATNLAITAREALKVMKRGRNRNTFVKSLEQAVRFGAEAIVETLELPEVVTARRVWTGSRKVGSKAKTKVATKKRSRKSVSKKSVN